MYSKLQIEALELLDKYFRETSESVIRTDIQAVAKLSFVGSSAKDYFSSFHKHLNYEPFKRELEISEITLVPKRPIEYSIPKMNILSYTSSMASIFRYNTPIKPKNHSSYNHIDVKKNKLKFYEKSNFNFNSI